MAYNYEYPYTDASRSNSDWILNAMREVMAKVDALDDWKETHESEYTELRKLYDDIIAGNFPPSVIEGFRTWMRENAIELVGELVKSVFFEITNTGYFVAYIPESWHDIIFNTTGLDISVSGEDFGHLVLSY